MSRLYKYVGPAGIQILTNSLVRFTQPMYFNDPYEAYPTFQSFLAPGSEDVLREMLVTYMNENPEETAKHFRAELRKLKDTALANQLSTLAPDQIMRLIKASLPSMFELLSTRLDPLIRTAVTDRLREQLARDVGILSLSTLPDHIKMWSHYADSHRGFVVEFDPRHPFFDQRKNAGDILRQLKPVRYVEHRKPVVMFDPRLGPGKNMERLADAIFLTKSQHWREEREWRMIIAIEDADEKVEADGQEIYLKRVPPDAVKGVTLGSKSSGSLEDAVRAALERSDLQHVRAVPARIRRPERG